MSPPTAAAVVCFLEGPAVDADGNVFFSDIAGNRILKMDPKGKVTVFRADSGRTNGNCFDAQGRLISCEGGEQGPRPPPHGPHRHEDRRNHRADRQVRRQALQQPQRLSASMPRAASGSPIRATAPTAATWRWTSKASTASTPTARSTRVLTQKEIDRPNGIAVTPDDKTLYVIDSHPKVGGNRKIWAFDVAADGSLGKQRLVYDFGKGRGGDGMKLDMKGNLWVAAGIN